MKPSLAPLWLLLPLLSFATEDEDPEALARLRARLASLEPKSHGVLLVAGPAEAAWADVAALLWESYCKRHGYGFLLQREQLTVGLSFDWTRPRALLELAEKGPWGYVMLVDGSSLPVDFAVTLQSVVKRHLRHKRYKQDDGRRRLLFCPWDCEEEYDERFVEGACYGPQVSGCVFHVKKRETAGLVQEWYGLRREGSYREEQRLVQSMNRMRKKHYAQVYFKDVQGEMGRRKSSFMASFAWHPSYGWNLRDQVHDFVKEHAELSSIINAHAAKGKEL